MAIHGGNIYDFSEKKREKIIDYSSNINPRGVSTLLKKEILKSFNSITRYPDIEYRELKDSIGEFNDTSNDRIIVGNGATEVLFLYMKALKLKRATIVVPTFSEYERALKSCDTEIDYYYLEEKDNFSLDVESLLKEGVFKNTDLVVICNPNNPTGLFIPLKKIKFLNEELEKLGIKLFIDESFIEFIQDWKRKSSINLKSKNIFILRALTKYFAIPGLRLGYGISFNKKIIKKIDEIREPWSINAFAEIAGRAVLSDLDYINKTEIWLKKESAWLEKSLKNFPSLIPVKSETNFILIKFLGYKDLKTSNDLKLKLLESNILIRDASNFRGLNETYFRIAIKDRKNNKLLIQAFEEVFNGKSSYSRTWK